VVAAGTTTVRAIESDRQTGETSLFIHPGFRFRRTGALLTNFHLPRSSLLVLVCAFGGTEPMLAAYRHAVLQRYRFFSYGDCMLIL
jgi:S-adenosylmethionine:tRNA ribosyltransferase-isomerase